jgi:hypothetical protein
MQYIYKYILCMNKIGLLLAVCFLAGFQLQAETVVTAVNGTSYVVKDWTPPVNRMIQAETVPVQIIDRQCEVKSSNTARAESYVIQLLFSPALGQVWVGTPASQYLVANGSIWGVFLNGSRLFFQPSEAFSGAASGLEGKLTTLLSDCLSQPGLQRHETLSVPKLVMPFYIGHNTIRPCLSHSGSSSLSLINAVSTPKGMTLYVASTNLPLDFNVTLGTDMRIVDLVIGGIQYPVLFDNAVSIPEAHSWYSLNTNLFKSLSGDEPGLYTYRWYYSQEADPAQSRVVAMFKSAVIASTGRMWIGPDACTCLVINGQIIGVQVNNGAREIQFFKSKQADLPLNQGTARAFHEQTQAFDQKLTAQNYRYDADFSVFVPSLFTNEPRLDRNFVDLSYRMIYLKNGNIVVRMDCSAPFCLEVVISPEFKVVSSRLIESGPEVNAF